MIILKKVNHTINRISLNMCVHNPNKPMTPSTYMIQHLEQSLSMFELNIPICIY